MSKPTYEQLVAALDMALDMSLMQEPLFIANHGRTYIEAGQEIGELLSAANGEAARG
jgi:hypothetical protein